MNLFNASANADIVTPSGRCTIIDDEATLTLSRTVTVGTGELTPTDPFVHLGEPITLSLDWTHPVGWRQLDSIDLFILDAKGSILTTRWHEAANAFSLLSP